MMIRIVTNREPVTVALRPPYDGVTITLRRLTSADFAEARQAVQAILSDDGQLLVLLGRHDLLPSGSIKAWKRMKDDDPVRYAAFISGIGIWLSAVECGVRGVDGWTGIAGEDGTPAGVSREALEVLMSDEAFSQQVMDHLDAAARILVVEGKP